jgi:hypothetical protein
VEYVVIFNKDRRHLKPSQLAMAAAKAAAMRQRERTDLPSIDGRSVSIKKAAEMLNVSTASIGRGREVLKKGTPR